MCRGWAGPSLAPSLPALQFSVCPPRFLLWATKPALCATHSQLSARLLQPGKVQVEERRGRETDPFVPERALNTFRFSVETERKLPVLSLISGRCVENYAPGCGLWTPGLHLSLGIRVEPRRSRPIRKRSMACE